MAIAGARVRGYFWRAIQKQTRFVHEGTAEDTVVICIHEASALSFRETGTGRGERVPVSRGTEDSQIGRTTRTWACYSATA
jgi:hypothetical protein